MGTSGGTHRRRQNRAAGAALLALAITWALAPAAPAHGRPDRCEHGQIVFTRFADDGIPTLYTTDPCGGALTPITNGHHASFSDDGRLLAYDSLPGAQPPTDVFVSSPDGSHARDVTNSPDANDLQPAFAPDARSVAYSTGTPGVRDARIAVTDLATGSTRVITPVLDGQEAFDPSWSPSGRWIVFDTLNSNGPGALWIVRADGRDLHQITTAADDACQPDWGPNGLIAYAGGCDEAQSHLFIRDPGGDHVRQVTTDPGGASAQIPRFSPDGTSLTFSRFNADFSDADVWRLDLRTGAETDVVPGPGYDLWSDWGPGHR